MKSYFITSHTRPKFGIVCTLAQDMDATKQDMPAPTNADIVRYLHRVEMHFSMAKPTMDEKFYFTTFEFRTNFGGTPHCFVAQFVDCKHFNLLCCNTEHTLEQYDRGNALKSLLLMRTFSDVEAFAVACRNALGDNIQTFPLAGSIFVNGKCVDELLSVLEEKANEENELATEVQKLKDKMYILTQLVTMLCVYPDFHRS